MTLLIRGAPGPTLAARTPRLPRHHHPLRVVARKGYESKEQVLSHMQGYESQEKAMSPKVGAMADPGREDTATPEAPPSACGHTKGYEPQVEI